MVQLPKENQVSCKQKAEACFVLGSGARSDDRRRVSRSSILDSRSHVRFVPRNNTHVTLVGSTSQLNIPTQNPFSSDLVNRFWVCVTSVSPHCANIMLCMMGNDCCHHNFYFQHQLIAATLTNAREACWRMSQYTQTLPHGPPLNPYS